MKIEDIVKETKAFYCLECGVCTGSCPVSRVLPTFSPRMMVTEALLGLEGEVFKDSSPWQCLTCGRCSHRCPSKVDYQGFIRFVRIEAVGKGMEGVCSHGGVLQGIMRLQAQGHFKQNRLGWATGVKVAEKGEYFYFVGCAPYFDVVFKHLNVNFGLTARNVVMLLNMMGIEPVVSNDERCCGHDLLWNGDPAGFKALAQLNIEMIRASGTKKVICACPEGFVTLSQDYPKYFGNLGFEVVNFYQLLAERLRSGGLKLNEAKATLTYQDPCRLGRLAGIYEEPRQVIAAIPGASLKEMERNRADAMCCGTSAWMNCTVCSEQIRLDRLKEAKATGAETLVTACPKCQIHFRCTLSNNPDLNLKVKDMADLVAEAVAAEAKEQAPTKA